MYIYIYVSFITIMMITLIALSRCLGDPDCKLRSLKLRGSDIDDYECCKICKVLSKNHTLWTLDLASNLIGKQENLNVVKPAFESGI